ncbi:hypothetical protein T07_5292 [Trichinella nelsoni]|uniref:Uncharacterized protein n=1 Tax=Trichinella nelsoni TaxID=6336 RepID=A0A0V0RVP0_9BILA|nr:hypothetical protein T07_5292 [Trichinella nelsoni]
MQDAFLGSRQDRFNEVTGDASLSHKKPQIRPGAALKFSVCLCLGVYKVCLAICNLVHVWDANMHVVYSSVVWSWQTLDQCGGVENAIQKHRNR